MFPERHVSVWKNKRERNKGITPSPRSLEKIEIYSFVISIVTSRIIIPKEEARGLYSSCYHLILGCNTSNLYSFCLEQCVNIYTL